jgi:hypothetical protein
MKIIKFDIANFKGVSQTSINLADGTPGNVNTLIGLNESGKTTILEALSNFLTVDKDTASLVGTVHQKSSFQDLVPKDKKAAFTDEISIKATVSLDRTDIKLLGEAFWREKSLILDRASLPKIFTVETVYGFEDSRHTTSHTAWNLVSFDLRSSRAKKFTTYSANGGQELRAIWLLGISILRERLPKLVYFPTFLFNFPDRIYLEELDDIGVKFPTNSYYRQVIQDVLDSQGDGLDVKRHVLDRVKRLKNEHSSSTAFLSGLFGGDEKKQIDAVLQKASNEMSSVIFGAWNQILGRTIKDKRVQIDWFLDGEKENSPYLEVSIIDGQSRYSLSERSLGFRWFFSFCYLLNFGATARKMDQRCSFLTNQLRTCTQGHRSDFWKVLSVLRLVRLISSTQRTPTIW